MKSFSAFTLIELLISISIIGIMATMTISSYPRFSEQINLASETYKMLSFTRETQIYGTAAVSTPGLKFVYAFLIDKDNGTIERYKIESPTDKSNQYYYNTATLDPDAQSFKLKESYEIEKICADINCSISLDKAYAFFKRPNPEARLVGLIGTNVQPDVNTGSLDRLEVYVRSIRNTGLVKKIVILQTGQMYVSDW